MFLFPWLYCLTIILAKPSASYPSPSYLLNPAPAVSNIIFAKTKQKLENMKQNYRIKKSNSIPPTVLMDRLGQQGGYATPTLASPSQPPHRSCRAPGRGCGGRRPWTPASPPTACPAAAPTATVTNTTTVEGTKFMKLGEIHRQISIKIFRIKIENWKKGAQLDSELMVIVACFSYFGVTSIS